MYKFFHVRTPVDLEYNIWKENQQLRYVEPFKSLYESDESADKKRSSDFMYCIWLYADPSYQNKIGKLSEDEKRSAILSYCPDFDFNDELINRCLIEYPEKCLSEAALKFKKSLKSIEILQDAIDKKLSVEGVTFNETINVGNNRYIKKEGTAKQITSIKKEMISLWKEYEKIKKMFEEEQNELRLYGGGKQTLLESGGLIMLKDEEDE
jgi:hypothetical protein